MNKPTNHIFEFGEFRLETAERLLLRAGNPISVTPKAFETLLVLVRSSGRLVKKDDLMKQVWPDAIVEEANLARNVWALRKALGDGNGAPAYIETIPKLGYRFVGPVTELPLDGAPPPQKREGPRRRFSPVVLAILVLVTMGVTSVGLARLWRETAAAPKAAHETTFLTDGSHDDVGASWTNNGHIHFSRSVATGRIETWTMNADGTNQHRANTNIRSLLAGRWSPDGKKVIFTKDGEAQTIYLADADGANEIALPFLAGNLDWSPDGLQFVYQARTPAGTSDLFLYTLATGTSVNLTNSVASADPSFSSDGTHIAFTSWRDGNAEIYVMRTDGSNVRRVTNHPAFDNYPVFSPDGTQIAFQSNREDEHVEVYLQHLNDSTPPTRLTRSKNVTGLAPQCWSPDGTRLLLYTNQRGNNQIQVTDVEPLPAQLLLGDEAADLGSPRVSSDGTRLLYEARRPDRSLELRLTHLATTRTEKVFKTEPDYPLSFHLEPAWSPDNSLIAFSARANGNSEIFVMNADGSGLRNVTNHPLLDSSPVFLPGGDGILFARDEYGQARLYRTDLTGRGQRRLTGKEGYEMNPAVSPDGAHLAFAGDRESHGLDILLLDLKQPDHETRLAARRSQDGSPSFSHDGKRIAFIATSDGNPEIYVINADGTGLFRVTHSQATEAAPQFSKDDTHIVFSSNRSGRFALYQLDAR